MAAQYADVNLDVSFPAQIYNMHVRFTVFTDDTEPRLYFNALCCEMLISAKYRHVLDT